jgi:DNA-binding response OmpR family regulator
MARIMIIDDDDNFGELTKQRLEGAGFEVIFHRGAFGTLNAVHAHKCDLLVVDVNMPGLRGDHLTRLIRETEGIQDTKVLLCSSMDVEPLQKLAAESGAHGYLSKAAAKRDLISKIRQILMDRAPPSRR